MKENSRKHTAKRYRALYAFAIAAVLTGASVWEGSAAVAAAGDLPDGGYYIATNSFPRNTVVDVTNLENGRTIRAIVAAALDSPGLLAMLSRNTATAIGIQARAVGRIRMIQPSDPLAYQRLTEGQNAPGDSGAGGTVSSASRTTAPDTPAVVRAPAGIASSDEPVETTTEEVFLQTVVNNPETYLPKKIEYPLDGSINPEPRPSWLLDESNPSPAHIAEVTPPPVPSAAPSPKPAAATTTDTTKPATTAAATATTPAKPAATANPAAATTTDTTKPATTAAATAPAPAKPAATTTTPAAATAATTKPATAAPVYNLVPAEERPPQNTRTIPPGSEASAAPFPYIRKVPGSGDDTFLDPHNFIPPIGNLVAPPPGWVPGYTLPLKPVLPPVSRDPSLPPAAALPNAVPAEGTDGVITLSPMIPPPRSAPTVLNPPWLSQEPVISPPSPPADTLVATPPTASASPAREEVPAPVQPAPPAPEISALTPPPAAAPAAQADPAPLPQGVGFSLPVITRLDQGKYYVQIGAYTSPDTLESAAAKIDRGYPLSVQPGGTTNEPLYRLLVGPLNPGESGAVLQRFKKSGYGDAFVRNNG